MDEHKPLGSRLKHAWNAFRNKDPTEELRWDGPSSYSRPDRVRFTRGHERSIITSIYNRIAMDVAAVDIKHARLDENGRFIETIDSGLNECLNVEANLDQTGRALIQDIVMSMLNEGVAAIVPVDTTLDPTQTGSYDIRSLRTGSIQQWNPNTVKVSVYDEKEGIRKDLTLLKRTIGIVENPFYAIMNEPNSTLQRLIRKLGLLDAGDERNNSGKLDLIIQLPHVIKSEARQQQAERRLRSIETQLNDSKHGIAYTDGTEKIIQLNRAVENQLMAQIESLTSMLYGQLGMTQSILDGTADEKTMLNYYSRTIEPIVSAIVEEMRRKFLTKTARSQFQSIMFFRDPFSLVPVAQISEMADKFTRNEILSPNEVRQIIGLKPSPDPASDELRNRNLNAASDENKESLGSQEDKENQNG